MSEILAGVLAIWFVFLGLTVMVRQHQRFLRWSWHTVQWPFRWTWRRWRMQIFAFFAGIGTAEIMQWNAIFYPVAIAAGIVLAVWLIGLAITHFVAPPDGAQRYADHSREIIADATDYLWTNFRAQIIWFSTGMIASIFL